MAAIDVQTRFLEQLPVSPEDRKKIAHGNADRLLKLNIPNASSDKQIAA
jgi:predicted TIM-barrel fold metal-dependent hydrolase